ncbi:YbaK/prolyl-tRNA synthetase associated domain-containing protein [Actinoplanes sp. LDG1-06]|uniref:YbaK/prolyl-tRNA synthetase associated domain-containing protein n=1 Tax=Paractinoplanes ovalisporus TaxID=2810368 RepID=A0ABS2AID2_9ACTN|nr:YbaK/EbsC family protein [Actinoplanes ovalisporus]MBM2619535.1 YbaK/prolyl-tRNA synthetase associated domain-containing protein [Actinoplanes ovalisporus]
MSIDRPDMVPPVHARLFEMLNRHRAEYRMISHSPGATTEEASRFRGHDPAAAAKSIILCVRKTRKESRYVLAVVPGDRRVDFRRVRSLFSAIDVSFAPLPVAERLAGSPSGTFMPFVFSPELDIVVDAGLAHHDEIFFNVGLADRSISMKASAYLSLSAPRIAEIAAD